MTFKGTNSELRTMELTVLRTIPASPAEVYDAWLDPEHPGNPWHDSDTLIFEPKVDALYYFIHVAETWRRPHFGRFLMLDRPNKVQQTLMSFSSLGLESVLTVSFAPKGADTLLTLHHANLPDAETGRLHEQGWGHYLGILAARFNLVET
jgi:uncharacterized protein YndB with AHSA1/START domain